MNSLPPFPILGVSLIFLLGLALAGSTEAASNDKRAFAKFNGTYKGTWNAAGKLPVTLRMPKGKGTGDGTFEATPCNPADDVSPLKLRITKTKVRRNGKKLISSGRAIWKRGDVPALIGPNLNGKLKVVAVLRGGKASAKGSMATGALGGSLAIRKNGNLPAVVCVERAFALPGDPVDITDNATTVVSIFVPNSVAVVSDLDVSLSIGSIEGLTIVNSDYDVTLRHVPSGTEIELFTDIGNDLNDDDGIFVRLDDDAPGGVDIGTVLDSGPDDFPIIGVFKPEAPATLATFNGVLASGEWRLTIVDDSAGLDASVINWTLHIR